MNYQQRIRALRAYMEQAQLDLALIFSGANQHYLTGFGGGVGTRLACLLIDRERSIQLVPQVEAANMGEYGETDEVCVYYEKPVEPPLFHDAMQLLTHLLKRGGYRRIGVEFGSASIKMQQFLQGLGCQCQDLDAQIAAMRAVKYPDELELIRFASQYGSLALAESFAHLQEGVSEKELELYGTNRMLEALAKVKADAIVDPYTNVLSGPERTLMPHVNSSTRSIRRGEIIVQSRLVCVDGYRGEIERTVFLGQPSPEAARIFQAVIDAREAMFACIRPGLACSAVDKVAYEILCKAGLGPYIIHRSGHGLGTSVHETPVFSFADPTILEPNMVFSVEPGVYVPGLGGIRHSDTVVVTVDGCEIITDYPRDIASLTF